jgi:chromosome segregation ATPase
MSEPLEELRAQRALIQMHLNWLDAQIANAEGSTGQVTPSSRQLTAEAEQATLKAATSATCINTAENDVSATTSTETLDDFDQERHLASGASDVKRAQIGCLLIFISGTLLFLFLLFVLPYLSD